MQKDKSELMANYVHDWLQLTNEHPECVLGDWLHTFSIMSGLALRLADVQPDALDEALERFDRMIRVAYENAKENFSASSLQ